jgi:hypothetical protein
MAISNPDTEYRQVYDGILAVASHCDGARTLDGVGFNGQDTKFGKRIAALPFEQWTPEIKQEAARISLTYKAQILSYTGIDVSTLEVVRQANGLGTNHEARRQAWASEKKKGAQARRVCDATPDGKLALSWSRDPDFSTLLDAVKALPGRWYDRANTRNVVYVTPAAEDFTLEHDFNVTPAAERLLLAMVPQVAEVRYDVTLHDATGRIIVKPPAANLFAWLDDVKQLPGREYQPPGFYDKENVCNAHPQVLVVAEKHGWNVHPDAALACEKARIAMESQHAADLAEEDFRTLMAHVSRVRSPEQLPPAFLELLGEVLASV